LWSKPELGIKSGGVWWEEKGEKDENEEEGKEETVVVLGFKCEVV
jgi:hypothetical protein